MIVLISYQKTYHLILHFMLGAWFQKILKLNKSQLEKSIMNYRKGLILFFG